MTMYDEVELYDDIHLPFYPGVLPRPDRIRWQTNAVPDPEMGLFQLTADGQLVKAEWEFLTEDETTGETVEYDGDDAVSCWLSGAVDRRRTGWTEVDFTGEFTFGNEFDRLADPVVYSASLYEGSVTEMMRVW